MGSEVEAIRSFGLAKSEPCNGQSNSTVECGLPQLQIFKLQLNITRSPKNINYCVCPHGAIYIPALLELHKQVRERRRSRSNSTAGRSRTPSSVSSGRTTPSPGPSSLLQLNGRTMSDDVLFFVSKPAKCVSRLPRKYTTTCWLEPKNVPVHFSSTVLIILDSTRKRYTENVTFQTRLTAKRFSESVETPVSQYYVSTIEIPCTPDIHTLDKELQQIATDSEA